MARTSPAERNLWPLVRIGFAFLSVPIAIAVVISSFGNFSRLCGSGCQFGQQHWYSPLMLIGLVVGTTAAVASQFIGPDQVRRRIAWTLGLAAVVAFIAMLSIGHFCAWCLAAQTVWAGLAVEAVGRMWFRVLSLAILGIGLEAAYEVWSLTAHPLAEPTAFAVRPYEKMGKASPHALVVFTDPYCPFCRQDERSQVRAGSPLPVLYRWKIVHGPEAVHMAAALESALATDPARGQKLMVDVYATEAPPGEDQFVKEGVTEGFDRNTLKSWIEHPEDSSLTAIAEDDKLANRLGVSQVPALCSVEDTGPSHSGIAIRPIYSADLNAYATMTRFDLSSFKVYVHSNN